MDKAERARLKQLANDAIIATFGEDTREQKLAEALERCVDQLEYVSAKWRPVCLDCDERLSTYDEALEDGQI